MEFVPGAPLSALIEQGRMRLRDALQLAAQIASALEAAHEKGLIHRDLKPANVRVTPDGVAKVLDFGLARQAEPPDDAATRADSRFVSHAGLVVGTPAYMSPEQARGHPVDKRTDIWAFGCVLFEMLARRQPFGAASTADIVAAIIEREPDWSQLPTDTPPLIRRLLRRCLEKDVSRRLRDIADARFDIEDVLSAPAESDAAAARRLPPWRLAALASIVGIAVGFAAASTLWPAVNAPTASGPPVRFVVPLAADTRVVSVDFPTLAISPDGTVVAYTATRGDRTQLFVRPLNGHEATPVPGSADAVAPFFSPDSQWIAFFAEGKLKKVAVTGGAPVTVCDAAIGFGGTWGADDVIVFAPAPGSPLWRVAASGGTPVRFTQLDAARGEFSHRWPEFLPDGRTVLFTAASEGSFDDAAIVAASIEGTERRVLIDGGTHPRYLASGHLLYARGGAAWATPFDARRLQITGSPTRVLEDVLVSFDGASQLSVSRQGTLVYITGSAYASPRRLISLDAAGVAAPLAAPPRAYMGPRMSPDGRKVLLTVTGAAEQVWLYDLATAALTQLTFESVNRSPIWTPDGTRITFSSNRAGQLNLFQVAADGASAPQRLTTSEYLQLAGSWSPDGSLLAYVEHHPQTGRDIWLLPATGTGSRVFVNSAFDETAPAFSPDGRWIAYVSNESGRNEVYLRSVANSSQVVAVTREGGTEPVWSRVGGELFFRRDGRLMAAPIAPGAGSVGPHRVVYDAAFEPGTSDRANYDVGVGARQFVMLEDTGRQVAPTEFHVLLNWQGVRSR
jgi:eukaryotic-like serine/threonine-protein kinase